MRQNARIGAVITLTALTLLLTGCSSSTDQVNTKTEQVETYNKLVYETLNTHEELKALADRNKEKLYNHLFDNVPLDANLITKLTEQKTPTPTATDLQPFQNRGILYDDYYTTMGSDILKQVIIVSGTNDASMTVTVLWSTEGIISLERNIRHA